MTPSDAAPADRRLHPWSWLFVLLQQLKQFIVPIVAAFFFGGDRNELWPLIGVGLLTLSAVMQYLTYRYTVGRDGITIRSGWLHRQRREIPYARIHNVSVNQSVLHRVFGVAELRLDSAGGEKPEATMRVLRFDDALALERLIRHRGAVDVADDASVSASNVLLAMSPGEVLRLGFVSNRGLLLLAGGYAASAQFAPNLTQHLFESWGRALFGYAETHHFGMQQYAFAGVTFVVAALALMRLLSLALALLQYFGFTLREDGPRLTVERGLLARSRNSASKRRLQAWTLHEGLMHRVLKRRSLQVDTAGGQSSREGQAPRALRELAPIATPAQCDALIAHLLPHAGWPDLDWQALHPKSAIRIFLANAWFPLLVVVAAWWRFGWIGLLALAWPAWTWFVARNHARRAGWAMNERIVAARTGWWSRRWRFAEIDKLQALRITQGPLDRRWGMATLWLDTAGASAMSGPLRIAHLRESDARALCDRLAHMLESRKLRW